MALSEAQIKQGFADRLAEYRNGAEKDEFWRTRGLNPGKMGRYENKKEAPRIEKIVEICEKTDLSPNWLLMGLQPKSLAAARRLKDDEASHQEKRMPHVAQLVKKLRANEVPENPAPRRDNKATQRSKKHLPASGNDGDRGRKA